MELKPKALIVEDSSQLAEQFAIALHSAGYDPEIKRNGFEAQSWLAYEVPDLILLNMQLPYISGDSLLKQIQKDVRLNDTVIFVTGSNTVQSRCLQNEVDLVLSKPISHKQLRDLSGRFLRVNA